MHYRLRTLLILMAVGPPMLAWAWFSYREYRLREETRLIVKGRLMIIITPGLIIQEEEPMLGIEIPKQ